MQRYAGREQRARQDRHSWLRSPPWGAMSRPRRECDWCFQR